MSEEYSFSEICHVAEEALQFHAQEQSQIKLSRKKEIDSYWRKVLPDLTSMVGTRLFLLLVVKGKPQVPWDGILSDVENLVENSELPDLSGFADGDLSLRITGRIWINRVAKRLVDEFPVALPSYDNQVVLDALLFDCLKSKESYYYFLELVGRIKNSSYKKASFGINLDETRFHNEVNSAYQILSNWAKKGRADDQWRDDLHLWLEKQSRKPFHRQIKDSLTLGVHNRNLWLTREGNESREELIGDEAVSELELAFLSPSEEEIELTEQQKAKIEGLLSEINGANPETGLSIIECILRTENSGPTEIAEATGYSTKTVSRYIGTKGMEGFLAQMGEEFKSLFDDN